jgi:hypothetical protein
VNNKNAESPNPDTWARIFQKIAINSNELSSENFLTNLFHTTPFNAV